MSTQRTKLPIRILFVLEQHVGHRTFSLNLRRGVEDIPGVEARWAEITYAPSGGLYEKIPLLPQGVLGTLRGRTQTRRALRSGGYDAVFFNTQVPAVIGVPLPRQVPYVLSTDITPIQYDRMAHPYGHRADRWEPVRSLKKRWNQRVMEQSARVLPWSTWVRRSLLDDYHLDQRRIDVLPPGIDTNLWKPRVEPRRAGKLRILFIGGDFYRKGGKILLDAYNQLPPGIAELHLVTRTTVPPLDGLTCYGAMQPNCPELIALAQSCDVFVLPSEAEAYGIAAAEACAAGLPVIASRMGGMVDIVEHSANGFIVTPGDARSIAEHLHQLAEDETQRIVMGQAARRRAVTRFDLRLITRRLVTILTEVVQSSQ